MAINSVDKAISYDDDDSEERVGFRRGGSRRGGGRRGGGRRGGRGGGGRRGSRRGRGGARRGSRSPRGNRARANRYKAKRSRTGRTTSRDRQVAGMRSDAAKKASGAQTRRGTTTTSQAVKQARADIANTQGTKYTGNLQKAIADANKRHRNRSLANRKNIKYLMSSVTLPSFKSCIISSLKFGSFTNASSNNL